MYNMCVIILVQRFEPQGRRLTNLHYYLIIWSFLLSVLKISSFWYIPMVQNLYLYPQCTQGVYFWDWNPSLLLPVPPTKTTLLSKPSSFVSDMLWFLKDIQKTKQYTSATGRWMLTRLQLRECQAVHVRITTSNVRKMEGASPTIPPVTGFPTAKTNRMRPWTGAVSNNKNNKRGFL